MLCFWFILFLWYVLCVFLHAVCHVLLSFCIYGVCIIDIFNTQQYQQVFDLWNKMCVCICVCMHACKCAGITNTVMTRLRAGVKYFFLFKLLRPAVSPPSLILKWCNGSLLPDIHHLGCETDQWCPTAGVMNECSLYLPPPTWLSDITSLFHASTFRAHVLIVRRPKLYYTSSGIITLKQVSGLKLLK